MIYVQLEFCAGEAFQVLPASDEMYINPLSCCVGDVTAATFAPDADIANCPQYAFAGAFNNRLH